MNEAPGNTVTTLAISEKRPQKSGGCVGIFFQLFDWNRRLAKKKLFSKKLLPPVRSKRASKKFGRDEKMPVAKLLLIADENRGGFPNAKNSEIDGTEGMQAPGLVARLMGLESMPAGRFDKPRKASVSEFYCDSEKKFEKHQDDLSKRAEPFCSNQDPILEKGQSKLDSRPQKLQKTGLFERRPVNRFGAETFHFKNVLSRSRKPHSKLASPVKSPRLLSGKNAARLMEAASRILEPSVQATNRAKCALTYSGSPRLAMKDQETTGEMSFSSSKQSKEPSCSYAPKPLKGQSSCRSCGNLLDVVDFRWTSVERVPELTSSSSDVSNISNFSSHGSVKSKTKSPVLFFDKERDEGIQWPVNLKNQDGAVSLAVQAKANVKNRNQNFMDGRPHFQKNQDQFMSSRQFNSQQDVALEMLNQCSQRQNSLLVKKKVPPKSKLCNPQSKRDSNAVAFNGPKDFVALNKNLNNCTRTKLPTKSLDNCKIDMGRNAWDRKDDSYLKAKTLARKRRPMTSTPPVENMGLVNSTSARQRNVRSDVPKRNGTGVNDRSMTRNSAERELRKEVHGDTARHTKDTDIVSFTFSSPMKHANSRSFSYEMVDGRKDECEFMVDERKDKGKFIYSTFDQKSLISDANDGNSSPERVTTLSGDALGALLEQKLRELSCSDGDALPARSTASILEELIAALTLGRPVSHEDEDKSSVGFRQNDNSYYGDSNHSDLPSTHSNKQFQADAKDEASIGFSLANDCDHHSPGSVLEACFSNDSCFSESVDGSSGHKFHLQSIERSYDEPQLSDPDADLSDSGASTNMGRRTDCAVITDFIYYISRMLRINPAEIGLTASKLNYTREVILNAELLFKKIALCNSDARGSNSILDPLLLDKLETLVRALWRNPKCSLGFTAKEGNQLRRFLFDCLIEFLDLKYCRHCNLGFNAWAKLRLPFNRERLARVVYEDIKGWRDSAGEPLEEIIEREMGNSSGKWINFEIEQFETGMHIERDMFDLLVDEMVIDLWWGRVVSS